MVRPRLQALAHEPRVERGEAWRQRRELACEEHEVAGLKRVEDLVIHNELAPVLVRWSQAHRIAHSRGHTYERQPLRPGAVSAFRMVSVSTSAAFDLGAWVPDPAIHDSNVLYRSLHEWRAS